MPTSDPVTVPTSLEPPKAPQCPTLASACLPVATAVPRGSQSSLLGHTSMLCNRLSVFSACLTLSLASSCLHSRLSLGLFLQEAFQSSRVGLVITSSQVS